ncbi:MAG: hypothetical protein ACOCY0_04645 [Roseicyclus sp.]
MLRPDPYAPEPWHRRALDAAAFAAFCAFCGGAGGLVAALVTLALAQPPVVTLP